MQFWSSGYVLNRKKLPLWHWLYEEHRDRLDTADLHSKSVVKTNGLLPFSLSRTHQQYFTSRNYHNLLRNGGEESCTFQRWK